ncbi:MAG: hypothetical protein JW819_13045, partial [Candidatus Krumholzibacteriota bacterium]|nr:hypothetical protein [Candidatus Krumholzibacteriota bacterium]
MNEHPPFGALPPLDLEGETVRAWVYCPDGLRGDHANPNTIQVFFKDSWWKAFYGSPLPVHEGYWYEVSTVPSTNEAPGGFMNAGFDPKSIVAVGVKVATPDGSTSTYSGRIYLDGVAFSAGGDLPVVSNEQCTFETDDEGVVPTGDSGNLAITGTQWCTDFPAATGDGCLRMQVNLDGAAAALDGGEVGVDLQYFAPFRVDVPVDLEGQELALYVYSPAGARGDTDQPNGFQIVVKDAAWKTEMGSWTPIAEGVWQKVTLIPSTSTPTNGLKDPDFDPTRIRTIGLKLAAGCTSAVYQGPLYMDAVCFPAEQVPLEDLRYGFETGEEGWEHETYPTSAAVTDVVQSAATALEGDYALRLDISAHGGAVFTQGATKVDMRYNPPPMAIAPLDLEGDTISAYVYCPPGSGSGDSANPNTLCLFAKDTNWLAEYSAATAIRDGHWVRVKLTPSTNAPDGGSVESGFDPKQIISLGVGIEMAGDYDGPLYLDHVGFPLAFTNVQYGFEASEQGFIPCDDPGNLAITSVVRTTAVDPAQGDACLRLDVDLDGTDATRDAGEASVDMQYYPPGFADVPADLEGREIAVYMYCPPGAQGCPTNANGLRVLVKDDQGRAEYGSWTPVQEGTWMKVTLTPSWTEPSGGGYMTPDFDPTRIRMLGISLSVGMATATYSGPIYMDAVSFSPTPAPLQDLCYGFESGLEGWVVETYPGVDRITQAVQSASASLEGSYALRLDVDVDSGVNPTQGAAQVDMRYDPPPGKSAPFDLDGRVVRAYVYCPTGTQTASWSQPNMLRLYVKDAAWKSSYGASVAMQDGEWVRLMLPVSTSAPPGGSVQGDFNPKMINLVGVEATMRGTYHGPLYLDHVSFHVPEIGGTNTDHAYTFDEPDAATRHPGWRADPDGWGARAWTSVYFSAGAGYDGSTALAADADIAETNAAYEWRKGVFLIWYNPPISLATKSHRIVQAKMKFVPGAEP